MTDINPLRNLNRPSEKHSTYTRDEMEAYKQLRTNIEFSSIDKEIRVLAVTSTDSAEAKTTTAVNLAKAMASAKNRVLLIDCDLRIPDIHRTLKLSNRIGLTNALLNHDLSETTLAKYLQSIKVTNGLNDLYVMTSGTAIPNPLEVLSSKRFKEMIAFLRTQFSFIVIDAPPVMPVADAIPISLAADGVIFCIAAGQTNRDRASTAITQLRRTNVNVIGTVLTLIQSKQSSYYYYNYNYTQGHKKTPNTFGHRLKLRRKRQTAQTARNPE